MAQITHHKFTIKHIEDDILLLEIFENEVIEADDIHLIYQGYDKLIGDREYAVLVHGNPFSSISDEAKEIAANKYASEKRKKVAIIANNLAHVLIVRFFVLWNNPKTPIQIFKSEEKAMEWVKSK